MMNTIKLPSNQLYILSGPPASGKSTFLRNLCMPLDYIVSSDALREQIMGVTITYDESGRTREHLSAEANALVFETMRNIVRLRMSLGLTTFVDATSTQDSDRSDFVKLANDFGVKSTVLIFNTPKEVAMERNRNRHRQVPDIAMERMFEKMQYESKHNYMVVDENAHYQLQFNELPHTNIDVVGDLHGLYDEFVDFINRNGYFVEDDVIKHPNDRKILFLGDVVDRGPKSVELLTLVANSVQREGHFMIRGNHDHKIYKYFKKLYATGERMNLSQSNAETVNDMMLMKGRDRDYLLSFLESLPFYYTYQHPTGDACAFVHADVTYFHPERITKTDAIYGKSDWGRIDSDAEYQRGCDLDYNEYILIRGHIKNTSIQDNVISLEHGAGMGGELTMLPLDGFIDLVASGRVPQDAKTELVKTHQAAFDYNEVRKSRQLWSDLHKLEGQRLVTSQINAEGLKIFKYSKKVFFDALWDEHPALLKARGIVLDPRGKVIQHPFTKVFNYGENGAGIDVPDDQEVIAIEKLNGFLGCVTRNPYKSDLLVTTTGAFDSDFVGYIKDHIDGKLRGNLFKFFHERDLTLMFEVIHKDDPHIIEYGADDHGLWLIGARGKGEHDKELSEYELDKIADQLGLRRPEWFVTTMGDIKRMNNEVQHEGYMVRDMDTHDVICKFKSIYYLTTKFLGRMGVNNIQHMFKNPDNFKTKVDEEYFDLVDAITKTTTLSEFMELDSNERIEFVRYCIKSIS